MHGPSSQHPLGKPALADLQHRPAMPMGHARWSMRQRCCAHVRHCPIANGPALVLPALGVGREPHHRPPLPSRLMHCLAAVQPGRARYVLAVPTTGLPPLHGLVPCWRGHAPVSPLPGLVRALRQDLAPRGGSPQHQRHCSVHQVLPQGFRPKLTGAPVATTPHLIRLQTLGRCCARSHWAALQHCFLVPMPMFVHATMR